MNLLKNIIEPKLLGYFGFVIFLIGTFQSCETVETELLDDPNQVSLEQSNIDFFLSSIQVDFASFFEEVTEIGMETTRIAQMFGPLYINAYNANRMDTAWELTYSGVSSDLNNLEIIAEEQGAYAHLGAAQIMEAYMVITLVDYLGDIPFSESLNSIIDNPNRDSGADIYDAIFDQLDEAIANLDRESQIDFDTFDFFYQGDTSKWIRLANTLKIKMYLQTRLVNENESTEGINEIINSGNYIQDASDDFAFQYSNNFNNPDSRHPIFARNFDVAGNVTDYMSNHFMTELNAGFPNKEIVDPRLRYYIYRQADRNAMDTNEQDCFGTLPPEHYGFSIPYCTTRFPGYWGRDHGDNAGIPPDGASRAIWGLYPVGGWFDNNQFLPIPGRDISTQGAGISPIMMSSFVDFMLAESALTLSTSGDAGNYLRAGMEKSIEKVTNFSADQVDPDFAASDEQISLYIEEVMESFSEADDDEKLNVIVKEYFIALFGSGVEAFNTYRRTGKPDNLQPLRNETDMFIRSLFYPIVYISNNSNAEQKETVFERVFWDTNPVSGFIN